MSEQEQPSQSDARWKEMVAALAARVGMSPHDVEAATEGRVKAAEVLDLMDRAIERGPEDIDEEAAAESPAGGGPTDKTDESAQ